MWLCMTTKWLNIDSAPKNNSDKLNYILIGDSVCLPDMVIWRNETPKRVVNGNVCLPIPEGWFTVAGSRSRINRPTVWCEIPIYDN
jgi:hypothetical protein